MTNLRKTCKHMRSTMIEISESDSPIQDKICTLMEESKTCLSYMMEDETDYSMSVWKVKKNFDLIIRGLRDAETSSVFEDKDIVEFFFLTYEMLLVSKALIAEMKQINFYPADFMYFFEERLNDEKVSDLEKKAINKLVNLI